MCEYAFRSPRLFASRAAPSPCTTSFCRAFWLVQQYCSCCRYVKPDKPVVSYLTPLTGCDCGLCFSVLSSLYFAAVAPVFRCSGNRLSEGIIEQEGVSFQQGLQYLRNVLPTTAVLLGQNIGQDVRWLELKEGKDFQVCHCSCS